MSFYSRTQRGDVYHITEQVCPFFFFFFYRVTEQAGLKKFFSRTEQEKSVMAETMAARSVSALRNRWVLSAHADEIFPPSLIIATGRKESGVGLLFVITPLTPDLTFQRHGCHNIKHHHEKRNETKQKRSTADKTEQTDNLFKGGLSFP